MISTTIQSIWFSFDSIGNSLYHARAKPETKEELITVVRRLVPMLADRSIYPGELAEEGFIPWNLTPEQATERIVREIEELGRIPTVTEICWFARDRTGTRHPPVLDEPRSEP